VIRVEYLGMQRSGWVCIEYGHEVYLELERLQKITNFNVFYKNKKQDKVSLHYSLERPIF